MAVKVGINSSGHIGRNYFCTLVASGASLEVIAVSDLTDNKTLAHLLKYDSILGRFPEEVSCDGDAIRIGGKEIKAFAERGPANLPWGELGVNIIAGSTGFFTDATKAKAHLDASAKRVLISAPTKSEDTTIIMGINDDKYDPVTHNVTSNTSCTTNCLAPMAKALNDGLGIVKGLVTTIHAYTQDQNLQDDPHKDLHRARAVALDIMPATTSAAKAVALVLPKLKDEFGGYMLRVPTPTGSATDFAFEAPREANVEEINEIARKTADGQVLVYTDESLVSKDIRTDSASCTFGSQLTKIVGNQVKVVGWCDNKWGYSNHLVDLTALVGNKL